MGGIGARWQVLVLSCLAMAAAALPTTAFATTPGKPGKIAFTTGRGGTGSNIYVVNPDGTGLRGLTFTGSSRAVLKVNFAPAFSPNGRSVAYVRWTRDRGYNIFLRPLASRIRFFDGKRLFRRWGGRIDAVAYAPSGRALVFSAQPPGRAGDNDLELFTVRTDGSRLKRLTRNSVDDSNPDYSPRGRIIAFERSDSIYTIRQDGRRIRRLTGGSTEDSAPSFAPSGRVIAFSRAPAERGRAKIWTVRVGGGGLRKVGPDVPPGSSAPFGRFPAFSPTGRAIAFQRYCFCASGPYDQGALFTMTARGDRLVHALRNRNPDHESQPSWGIRPGTRQPVR